MSVTLLEFLVLEAEGKEEEIEKKLQAAKEQKMINLMSDIKKVMRAIDMTHLGQSVKDPRSFTFIDLLEALNTTKEVIESRLRGRKEKFKDEKDVNRFFKSVEEDVKDAVKTVFQIPGAKTKVGSLPRFVNTFNNLVVEKIIEYLKNIGLENADKQIGPVIELAKKAVINIQQNQDPEEAKIAREVLRDYRTARAQTIGKKNASQRSKQDRLRLIANIAQKLQV